MAVVEMKHSPAMKSLLVESPVSSTYAVVPMITIPEKLHPIITHSKTDNVSFKKIVAMIPAQIGYVLLIVETRPSGNFYTANTKQIYAITPQMDRPIRVYLTVGLSWGQKGSPRHFRTENACKKPKAERRRQISSEATPEACSSFMKVIYTILIT